jgi:hypothetical protein
LLQNIESSEFGHGVCFPRDCVGAPALPQFVAHQRARAFRANQRGPAVRLTALVDRGHTGIVRLDAFDTGMGLEFDSAARLSTLVQGGVNVGTMNDGIRIAESLPQSLVGQDAAQCAHHRHA